MIGVESTYSRWSIDPEFVRRWLRSFAVETDPILLDELMKARCDVHDQMKCCSLLLCLIFLGRSSFRIRVNVVLLVLQDLIHSASGKQVK